MTIWIDAGHGGSQPGAVHNGRLEKDDTLLFALELERCFQARGCKTILTRRTDVSLELGERTLMERRNKCNLAISCHRNAGNAAARGVEIWLHHAAEKAVVDWARETAKAISAFGLPLRAGVAAPGVYTGYRSDPNADYAVNRETRSPSMLLEAGFLTNQTDNAVFDEFYPKMCDAVANAACRFLGLENVPESGQGSTGAQGYEALYRAAQEQSEQWKARAERSEARLGEIRRICAVQGGAI